MTPPVVDNQAKANTNTSTNPLLDLPKASSETGRVISHFKIGIEIGRGSFANVYKGTDLGDAHHKTVAIKSVFRSRLKNQKLISNLEVEIKILRNLKNPHIVSLLDCVKTDDHFHLVMDYCSMGDLSYFIKKRNQLANHHPIIKSLLENYPSPPNSNGLNQLVVINFIKQLASALEFLRSQNLIHRDIKPQNLLLCPPCHSKESFIDNNYKGFWELPVLKVADFGFARYLPSSSMAETLCGSPLYMAPEILRYEKYNAKADLWSVGAVIYEMTVGKPPFMASNHIELLKKIEKSNDEINFPTNLDIDQNLVRLICNLLKANPMDRMGFTEFFNDPIITSNNDAFKLINDSLLSCSVDNEEMYVSEYLNGVELANKVTKNEKLENISKPLNRLTIKEEDEEQEEENRTNSTDNTHGYLYNFQPSIHSLTNSLTNLKSSTSNVVVTKENVETRFEYNEKQIEEMLQKHQQKEQGYPNQNQKNKNQSTNDIIVENDYVVVEKRNVEVNSFADEISKKINNHANNNRRRSSSGSNIIRRYSSSVSASTALKDVFEYTTEKIFGNSNNPNNNVKMGTPSTSPKTNQDNMDKQPKSNKSNDELVHKIENLAMMAHSLIIYAEVKFSQVIPLPPLKSTNYIDTVNDFQGDFADAGVINDKEYNAAYKKVCEEGLVLYLKSLSLLSESIKISSEWWNTNKFKSDISPKIGELIQWIRNRFNESLERAEYLKLRINRFEEVLDVHVSNNIVYEKLVFDRAIEISKETAAIELKNSNDGDNFSLEELKKCEISYSLSVWMLESLLHSGITDTHNESSLEDDDKKLVESFINSIGTRLWILRGKLKNNDN